MALDGEFLTDSGHAEQQGACADCGGLCRQKYNVAEPNPVQQDNFGPGFSGETGMLL